MRCCGCKQLVYVICHQAPGVKAALVFGGLFCEYFQEIPVVTVFMETGCPVVASLDDVPGYAGSTRRARRGMMRSSDPWIQRIACKDARHVSVGGSGSCPPDKSGKRGLSPFSVVGTAGLI
jgi:hypothetical protein